MKILLYLPYYVVCFALAGLLWQRPLWLLAAYAVLSAAMLWRWHRPADLAFYAVPAVLGPLGEMFAIYHGAWEYARPLVLIPIWLPPAWGCAALFMKKTADALAERGARPPTDAAG